MGTHLTFKLFCFLGMLCTSRSWIIPRVCHDKRCPDSFTRSPLRTSTSLQVFGFFSKEEKETNDDDKVDVAVASSLAEISDIMDSMSGFQTSKRVSDRTNAILQELKNVVVEGLSADGKVKVTFNGQQQPLGVQIDEIYFQSLGRKSGARELSIALTDAMKDAHKKSGAKLEDKLKTLYSDLNFDS